VSEDDSPMPLQRTNHDLNHFLGK